MRKVNYVRLHDLNIVIAGVGGITKELPMANKTLPGLSMFVGQEEGLLSVYIGRSEFAIPLANVQFMTFDSEDKPKTQAA